MKLYYDTFETVFGPVSAAVNESGYLVCTTFGGREALMRRGEFIHDAHKARDARGQLREYFAGKRRDFDLALAPAGSPFQQSVWAALRRIAYGQTRTYGAIAKELEMPATAARAVGQAVGSNPLCPIIPCHRVVAANGSLGGFYFGLPLKRRLLTLEGRREEESLFALETAGAATDKAI